jgi:DNA polymerase/3'-5' exonuclease PolX
MPTNAEVAEVFRRIADLLDVLGERFKPEAYRRAARSLESLPENVAKLAERNELREVPGVGEAIEEKIRELLSTGKVGYLERLEHEVPPGVVEIMRLPGLGPKTARRFWVELGIEGPAELREAIGAGRLVGVKGFGDRKIDQIREALGTTAAGPSARTPIEAIYPVARAIVTALQDGDAADRVEVAGSFRRGRESVGDLDVLVTSAHPEKVFDRFSALPEVGAVRLRGGTKETVVLTNGLQVDLRVVEPAAFGAALQYFTGSKDHNVRLRSLARDQGLKVNEYGVFRDETRVAGATEEEVYAALGLAWIPPELREDRGEIDLARAGRLPKLIEASDLVGDPHVHLPPTAGTREAERLGTAARDRGLRFLGLVVAEVDVTGSVRRLEPSLLDAVRAAAGPTVEVVPVVERGPGPLPRDLRGVVVERTVLRPVAGDVGAPASVDSAPVWAIAHVGGASESVRPWTALSVQLNAGIEVGPGADRVDSSGARGAIESGARLVVTTGIGGPDATTTEAVALAFARRAGAQRENVENAAPWPVTGRRRSKPAR